jgi:epoxide hydrolase-like predicted phosphatase
MIRALIFDCFGVVLSDDIQRIYNLTQPDHHDAVRELVRSIDRGTITVQQFVDQIVELSGRTETEVMAIVMAEHDCNEVLIERIKQLRHDYKIGMLSNVNKEVLDTVLPQHERDELFDEVVISGEVGFIKPEPAIYELMATRLEVAPAECLFIDDRSPNIEAAKRVGMQAVVFTSNTQFENDLKVAVSHHARTT